MWFKCFYELPDDDSFGIETRNSVESLSLNKDVSDWHVLFHYYVFFVKFSVKCKQNYLIWMKYEFGNPEGQNLGSKQNLN